MKYSGIPTYNFGFLEKKKQPQEENNIGKSPVIFDIAYTPYRLKSNATEQEKIDHEKKRAFYDMSGKENIYKYITTEGKIFGEQAKKFTMLEYLQKSTGVFNKDGMLSKEQVKEIKKRAQTGEKNIWSGFISFSKEQSEVINHPDKCIKLIKDTFDDFFRDAGFDPKNMDIMCSLHLDKPEHLHIHYVFFEKEPIIKNKRAKGYLYRAKGKIPLDVIEKMTARLNEYELDKKLAKQYDMLESKLYKRDDFTEANIKDVAINRIKELAKILPKEEYLWYGNKEMKEFRPHIDRVVETILFTNTNLNQSDYNLKQRLHKVEQRILASNNKQYELLSKKEMSELGNSDPGLINLHITIKTVGKLEWDYKRRMGNEVIRHIRYIQNNTYKRNPKYRYKTNDKNLKRLHTISNRKISRHINKFLDSVVDIFMPTITTYNSRLSEIEKEMLEEKQEQKQKSSRYNYGK